MSDKKKGIEAQSRAHISYLALHKQDEFKKVSNKERWLPKNMPSHNSLCRHPKKSSGMAKQASVGGLAGELIGMDEIQLFAQEQIDHVNSLIPPSITKHAITLIEHDPVIPTGRAGEKIPKTIAYYRMGSKSKSCGNCENFAGGSSCKKIDGSVKEEAVCDYFEDDGSKDMEQSKTARTRGAPGRSCAVCTSSTSDSFCKTAGEYVAPAEFCGSFCRDAEKIASRTEISRRSIVREMDRMREASPFQKRANMMPGPGPIQDGGKTGTVGANLATLLDGEIEENKQLRQQLTAMQQQQAQAQQGPPQIDPNTGQPMPPPPPGPPGMPPGPPPIDPMTGQPVPPPPPPPSPAEIQLQTALQGAEQQLEAIQKENQKLKDENRALHHAVEPDEMSDTAKKMYDRAGTNIQGEQTLPNESAAPETKLPQGTLQQMLDKAMF